MTNKNNFQTNRNFLENDTKNYNQKNRSNVHINIIPLVVTENC